MPLKRRKIETTQHESASGDNSNVLTEIQQAVRQLNAVANRLLEREKQFGAMEHVVAQLQNVTVELKHTKEQFEDMHNAFNELKSEFHSHLMNESQDVIEKNSLINDMDIQRSELHSKHLLAYTSNEGKHIWSLDERKSEQEDTSYFLQCKLCATSKKIKKSILNDDAIDERNQSETQKKPSFSHGCLIILCVNLSII
eukprot:344938_1